jgi:hypothetical protein
VLIVSGIPSPPVSEFQLARITFPGTPGKSATVASPLPVNTMASAPHHRPLHRPPPRSRHAHLATPHRTAKKTTHGKCPGELNHGNAVTWSSRIGASASIRGGFYAGTPCRPTESGKDEARRRSPCRGLVRPHLNTLTLLDSVSMQVTNFPPLSPRLVTRFCAVRREGSELRHRVG